MNAKLDSDSQNVKDDKLHVCMEDTTTKNK